MIQGKPPLVVDLDGTLIKSDVVVSATLRLIQNQPWRAPLLLLWLVRGMAHLKAQVARAAPCDPAALPYDQRVLAWLKQQKATGRVLALATASDESAARLIADHLGLFDQVFASDGVFHLKGANKARKLSAAFPSGFAYAGNAWADLHVWRAAKSAVVVNAPPALARRAERDFEVERRFDRE